MKERNYLELNEKEFLLAGKDDGYNYFDNSEILKVQSEKIIDTLLNNIPTKKILTKLINYMVGYKIGLISKNLENGGIYTIFDTETKRLMFFDKQGEAKPLFNSEFKSQINAEAVDKAIKTLSNRL